MKKLILSLGVVFGLFVIANSVSATTANQSASPADQLQPASTITYNEELVVNGTGRFDSVYIGKQDEGGVTFFNGTIINTTTDTDTEAEIPVTFGDDVRIDGRIWRTEEGGDNPIRVADTLVPSVNNTYDLGSSTYQFKDAYFTGTVTVAGLSGTGIVSSNNITDGTIATADIADSAINSVKIAAGAVTQTGESSWDLSTVQTTTTNTPNYDLLTTQVNITTDNSTLLCMFSGTLQNNIEDGSSRIILYVDGSPVPHTLRRGTTSDPNRTFNLAFTALVNVSAGSHTIQVGWNTDAATTASLYGHTLDVIELKK